MSGKQVIGGATVIGAGLAMPFSKAVRAGDFVFVSGITAVDAAGRLPEGNVEAQTRAVLEAMREVLEFAGCGLADVVKTTVWLDDPRDFMAFNRVYAEYFPHDPPARSTVRAALMLDCKVEIEAVAYCPR